jgi:hypothetical protein
MPAELVITIEYLYSGSKMRNRYYSGELLIFIKEKSSNIYSRPERLKPVCRLKPQGCGGKNLTGKSLPVVLFTVLPSVSSAAVRSFCPKWKRLTFTFEKKQIA